MTLKSKKFTRPVITPFEEDADPVGLARTVAEEYQAMEDGHHARLRAFLGRAYQSYQLFLDFPDSFEQLKQEPFWETSRQAEGPHDLEVGPVVRHASGDAERSHPSVQVRQDPRRIRSRRSQSQPSPGTHQGAPWR